MKIMNSIKKLIMIQMKSEETINYNFLIIGRSGSGKSATTKFLTGDPSVLVANSIKQVTTQVKFYEGITVPLSTPLNGFKKARFGVIDLPGLDKTDNRFFVREKLLEQLVTRKISINGVIYVASLTQRDTIDPKKMFKFIQQLPWYESQLKHCLIPVLTKYDNLVIDSPDQQISSVLKEFQQMFHEAGYSQAWSKRIYWINHTKSLDFKMKIREQIKQVYEKQLQRLLSVAKKNKIQLTADTILEYVEQQQSYVAENLLMKIANNEVPCSKSYVEHKVGLKIIVRPAKFFESVTTVSASSIGIILSQLCKKQIPSALSLILTGIPMIIAFLNLIKSSSKMAESSPPELRNFKNHNQQKIEKICKKIKQCITQQWKEFVQSLQFFINTKFLYARFNLSSVPNKTFIFLEPQTYLELKVGQKQFQRVFTTSEEFDTIPFIFGQSDNSKVINEKDLYLYRIEIPQYDQQHVWMPQVEVICGTKIFDEKILLTFVQNQRITFIQDGRSQSKIIGQIMNEQKHQNKYQDEAVMQPIAQ